MSESERTTNQEPYTVSRKGEDWFWVLCNRETPQDNEDSEGDERIQRIYYFQRVANGTNIPEELNAVSLPDGFDVDISGINPKLVQKE